LDRIGSTRHRAGRRLEERARRCRWQGRAEKRDAHGGGTQIAGQGREERHADGKGRAR
jgi:hypothetical protein